MRLHAQIQDETIGGTQQFKRSNGRETRIHEEAKHGGNKKTDNLIAGNARWENANGYIRGSKQQQANVRAPRSTAIDISYRIAQRIDSKIIDQRWDNCDYDQQKTGKVFCSNNLNISDWFCDE